MGSTRDSERKRRGEGGIARKGEREIMEKGMERKRKGVEQELGETARENNREKRHVSKRGDREREGESEGAAEEREIGGRERERERGGR